MKPTCAYCDHHLWMDELRYHACCIDLESPSEMSCAGDCPRFKKSRRGTLGNTFENIIEVEEEKQKPQHGGKR